MGITSGNFGKYELHERLGEGGMAEVWKAYDPHLHRYVAIKFLHADLRADPDFMTRFVREAQTVASLHHPNIVHVHDFWVPDALLQEKTPAYMVMNYVEGQTLAQYILRTSRKGLFPPAADIAHLFVSISGAIDYAHQRGIVHRDIKPSNILLDKRNTSRNPMGEPILTDFGIVKLIGANTSTLIKGFIGTPGYVSPEQAKGYPGDWRSDIYSLGVILYEIWTGVRPFQGESPFAIAMQHISTLPPSPDLINPLIPHPIVEVILAGLAKEPADRYSSASTMTNALIQAINASIPENPGMLSNAISEKNALNYLSPIRPITPLSVTPPGYQQQVPPTSTLSPTMNGGPKNTPVNLQGETPVADLKEVIGEENSSLSVNPSINTLVKNTPGETPFSPSIVATPTTPVPPTRTATGRRPRAFFMLLIAMFILVLTGSSLGAVFLLSHKNAPSISASGQIVVGNAFFISSGWVQMNDIRGIADEIQLSLTDVPAPAPGKSYYAWLLTDLSHNPMSSTELGKLIIDHGNATLRYPGDIQHTNLLATMSRLLITEENGVPTIPSSDKRTWRYYAELPQKLDPVEAASALDRIRGLLCFNPILQQQHIHVVLDIQFLNNTQVVLQLANAALNSKSPNIVRSQVAEILDYIDGEAEVRSDVPISIALPADQTPEQLALIQTLRYQASNNYIYLMHQELYFLQSAPEITPTTAINHLAFDADTKLNASDPASVISLLRKLHTDAQKLISMTNAQLVAPSSLAILNDMETSASNAYASAVLIDNDIQHLATFVIQPYRA